MTSDRFLNLLLIEDNPGDARLLQEMLAETGAQFKLTRRERFAEGLEALRQEKFQAVLLDLSLPDSQGITPFERLHSQAPYMPVVVLTGLDDEQTALAAMQMGAQDYLVKGRVTGPGLLRAIRYAIERKMSEQALRRAHDELEKRVLERTARLAQSEAQAKEAWREAERANKAKDEFLAVLSHELRTPLTAMLGWVRLLQSGRLDDAAAARGLQVIERNVKVQAHIIEDLLDVSRIVAGKLRLEKTLVDVAALTQAALETLRPIAQEKRITLAADLGPSSPPFEGDAARLQQVVWNLVSNALKFTPAGGQVEVSLANQGDRLVLKIKDTGRGIKREFLPQLFTRFTQEDSSTNRAYTGLGLGLAIVSHIVKLHGGTIKAESAGFGQGATFTVTLPLTATEQPEFAAAGGGQAVRAAALQGLKVLIVEDDLDVREVFAEALRIGGAVLEIAGTADEALVVFKRFKPEVVVSDIGLPGEDGYTLMREIRAWEKAGGVKATPAIAVTGYAQVEDHTRVHEAGYLEHLAKPVEPETLIALISSVAGK